jgi:hypothetical protein
MDEIERMSNSGNTERIKELFPAALTFLSILLGVFTFSLMNAVKWKGQVESGPWNLLTLVTGFGIVASGIISAASFYHQSRPINPIVEKLLIGLMYSILVICGLGTPLVGLWLYLAV